MKRILREAMSTTKRGQLSKLSGKNKTNFNEALMHRNVAGTMNRKCSTRVINSRPVRKFPRLLTCACNY